MTRLRLTDASIRIDSMPVTGRDVHFAPAEAERAALAEIIHVTSIERLDVRLHAVRFRGGIRVTGQLTAAVTQPSVVTLEPIVQEIAEPIDRIFLPGGEKPYAGEANAEIFVDLEGDDIPDHFEGHEADLTDLIIEALGLAVDLYPREAGVTLADLDLGTDVRETSPFDVLKALKPKGD